MPRKAKVVEEPVAAAESEPAAPVAAPAKEKKPREKKAKAADAPIAAIAKPAKGKKAMAAAPVKKRKSKSTVDETGEPREKRSPNVFFLFKDEVRDAVLAENPGVKTTGLSKLIGERYRALPESEKARLRQRAAELSAAHKAKWMATKA